MRVFNAFIRFFADSRRNDREMTYPSTNPGWVLPDVCSTSECSQLIFPEELPATCDLVNTLVSAPPTPEPNQTLQTPQVQCFSFIIFQDIKFSARCARAQNCHRVSIIFGLFPRFFVLIVFIQTKHKKQCWRVPGSREVKKH